MTGQYVKLVIGHVLLLKIFQISISIDRMERPN